MKKLALIDLGSNSARMSVAELTDSGYKELYRRREMVRLSEGMNLTGNLLEEPQARAIAALAKFSQEANNENAEIIAVATAAVRRAQNGAEFCRRVLAETGIRLSVISGKQEAEYDFYGVLSSLPDTDNCLIADVGGGSTELILANNGTIQGKISLPFGAMTLTDRYFRKGEDIPSAKAEILSLYGESSLLADAKNLPLIALGGSAGALPHLDARLQGLSSLPEVHGYSLTPTRLKEIFDALLSLTPEERIARYQLEPGRADTICAGILPLLLLLQETNSPRLTVCTAGLREGMMVVLSAKKDFF